MTSHGVPLEKLRRVDEVARKSFGQPLDEKRKVRRDERLARSATIRSSTPRT